MVDPDYIKQFKEEYSKIGKFEDPAEPFKFDKAIKSMFDKNQLAEDFLKIQPLYFDKARNWWAWNFEEFRWEIIDETDVLNNLKKHSSADTINSKQRTEALEALRQNAREMAPLPSKQTWIQFKDLIYDIKTDETFNASPRYFVTNPIPWKLGENDGTPMMDKIFEEWVGKDYIKTLYQILSYCLIPSCPIHRLFCFIGPGSNGKSCFLELAQRFIGYSNVTSTELDILLNSRFEITRLHKKLLCLMGETDFNEISRTSILKKLTAGERVGFEYKNKNPFEEFNYAKIMISTNNLPTTSDKTYGFYRRWLIIDFPNMFSEKKSILDSIPNFEYENLAKKCLKVLKELLENKEFHNEGSIDVRMKKFEDKSNPLENFMREKCDTNNVDAHIFKYEFRQRLDDWCREHNFRIITDTTLGLKMKELGMDTIQMKADWFTKDGEKPLLRAWGGIKWVNMVNTVNTTSTLLSPIGEKGYNYTVNSVNHVIDDNVTIEEVKWRKNGR
jgi:P4 family phage/plasmid primase-like protien